MSHNTDKIDPLPETAQIAAIIRKLNEVIEQLNHNWHFED